MSVAGSMSWVVRSCRPEESYAVSCAQQQRNKATVQQLLDVNQAVIDLQADPKRGLMFLPGIDWYNATLGVIADASHAGEVEWIDDWKELEAFRSQGARILVIADKAIAQNKPGMFYAIGYGSTVIRRVCRATVQSEGTTSRAQSRRATCLGPRSSTLVDYSTTPIGRTAQPHP